MSPHHLTPLILVLTAAVCLAGEPSPSTFCNPLPLPNYPIGRNSPIDETSWLGSA